MSAPTNPEKPRKPLKPLDEALAELLVQAAPLTGVDTVSLFEADGRVLAHRAALLGQYRHDA